MRGCDVVERNNNKGLGMNTVRASAVLVALAGLAPAGAAHAADWHINSSVTGEFTYDDNFRMRTSNEESLWGFNTRPRVGIETHTPRTDLNLDGALNYGYFPDNTKQNSFDQQGSVSLRHRAERSSIGVSGNISHQTTRTSEDTDSGRDLSDTERVGLGGNASFSHSLTERIGVGISGSAGYVTYDTNALNDYRTYSAGPFLNIVLTEKDSLQFDGSYTRFERLTGNDLESDLFVGKVTWSRTLTQQLVGNISGGANYVMTDEDVSSGGGTVSRSEDNYGYNASIGLTYFEERASFGGSFAHSVVPSSLGRLQNRNALNLNALYRATPVINIGFSTSFIQQEATDGGGEDRNFISAEPSVSWHFLPDWSARAAYRFRTQTLDNGERAYSNGVLASVSWHLPSWGAGQGK